MLEKKPIGVYTVQKFIAKIRVFYEKRNGKTYFCCRFGALCADFAMFVAGSEL